MLIDALQRQAHVWFTDPELARDEEQLQRLLAVLSSEERERHRRLIFPEDRRRYLVSHALVREALSIYIPVPPNDWRFVRGAHGRPEIANVPVSSLRFNLTHTEGLACCIVTLEDDCGIDAEKLSARHATTAIASRMFSEPENQQLARLRGQDQLKYFLTCWTLREAYVKATGAGIFSATDKLIFRFAQNTSFQAEAITLDYEGGTSENSKHWQFELLKLSDSHITTVAIGRDAPDRKEIIARPFDFPG